LDSAILLQKDGEINKKINAQVQEKEKVMFIQFIQFIPSSNPAPDPNSFSWASSLDRTLSSCTLKSSEFHWGVFPVKALQKLPGFHPVQVLEIRSNLILQIREPLGAVLRKCPKNL